MSQYPNTGHYLSSNPPTTLNTGTTGITNTGTGLGTGTTTGYGTTGYGTAGTGYGSSGSATGYGTTGTTIGQQPIIKRKHRPQSRSSSSSSSDKEKQTGQKQGIGQKLKSIPAKVKEMVSGHHGQQSGQSGSNYPS